MPLLASLSVLPYPEAKRAVVTRQTDGEAAGTASAAFVSGCLWSDDRWSLLVASLGDDRACGGCGPLFIEEEKIRVSPAHRKDLKPNATEQKNMTSDGSCGHDGYSKGNMTAHSLPMRHVPSS